MVYTIRCIFSLWSPHSKLCHTCKRVCICLPFLCLTVKVWTGNLQDLFQTQKDPTLEVLAESKHFWPQFLTPERLKKKLRPNILEILYKHVMDWREWYSIDLDISTWGCGIFNKATGNIIAQLGHRESVTFQST